MFREPIVVLGVMSVAVMSASEHCLVLHIFLTFILMTSFRLLQSQVVDQHR